MWYLKIVIPVLVIVVVAVVVVPIAVVFTRDADERGPLVNTALGAIRGLLYAIVIPVLVIVVVAVVVVPIAVVFTRDADESGPLVNTALGAIRGLHSDDGTYSMFLGIPYAVVGANPFGAAIPNPNFTDVFNAFTDSVRCPQMPQNRVDGSLDCLQLNIYVPRNARKPLPVLVYTHGGRFMMGTSAKNSFGPKFLVRHDVIYVSFHYRLSVYGFMCLHTADVPGNQGLKDQLAALRWIKNNIKEFGGDVDNITLFGDSAGGVSVDLHLLFAEEGLFHKVILQSGTSLCPWGVQEPDLDVPFKIARQLGFETDELDEAVRFLSNQTATRVIEATASLSLSFVPCVEKSFPNVDSFVTEHPINTPISKARSIPIIAGYTDDERLMTYGRMPDEQFETLDVFNHSINLGFAFNETDDAMKAFVRRFYIGDEPISARLRQEVTDFDSDFTFVHPTQRSLAKYLENNGVAYHYVFSYVGGRNMMRNRLNMNITEGGGASHSDDLGYLFDLPTLTGTPTAEDQVIIDRITTLWTNFAKYGDPTPTTTDLFPVRWLPVTRDSLNYLNLTNPLAVSTRPFHQRLTFWDFFYDTNEEYVLGHVSSL
ncbi:bile salt-activated lipase-like [Epargyreus clarus]|uniref:bile salt-activated lipase-like n=1 Tax=Epargyreus clarus TaxID=520877 RepID=UPI003C2B99CC